MKTSDFTFDLPEDLIARRPLDRRSHSRLLHLDRSGEIEHRHFYDLPEYLNEGDLLVFNNTKVIPARLYAQKETGGKVEILIERILDHHTALAHVKGAKNLKEGNRINLSSRAGDEGGDDMIIIGERRDELIVLTTSYEWPQILEKYGHMPLPPYMQREDEPEDQSRYQTVYAEHEGSVAAPTAGLHFDDEILDKLKAKGVEFGYVTLHVGAGTFQPVRVEDVTTHKMHSEIIEVNTDVCAQIKAAKKRGGRVIAVGTTSVRSLESAAQQEGGLSAYQGETDIFIYPGYDFQVIDGMITNFHLPESTLLMLVSAFSGKECIIRAYLSAINEKYRFFSYGDSMLLT